MFATPNDMYQGYEDLRGEVVSQVGETAGEREASERGGEVIQDGVVA